MRLASALKVRPKLLLSNNTDSIKPEDVTIVLCISRYWPLSRFFAAFNEMRLPSCPCHLLIFDNSDNAIIDGRLRKLFEVYKPAFASVQLWKSYRQGGDKILGSKDEGFDKSKLPVIYAMHRDICDILRTERFVMLEDDTLAPPDAIVKLLSILQKNKKCGVAVAIETGRSVLRHSPVRLGVHYITRDGNRIVTRVSLSPNMRGVVSVDACGWYCVASYTKLWKQALLDMRKYVRDVPRFGLDNIHTNNIKLRGYDILADFSLWCRHMSAAGGRILEWGKEHAIPMVDLWIPFYDCYAQGIQIRWQKKFVPKRS